MKIAIIGAGFTGLAAAYELAKQGHLVTVFERDLRPGGLAIGYQEPKWEWTLEKHYHHWFTNDDFVLNLAKEIGHEVVIKKPKSSFFIKNKSYQFDSPTAILSFPKLPFFDKVRMAVVFALLFRFNPLWKPLEKFKVATFVPKLIGKKAYQMLWEPQLKNKMGSFSSQISLVWFWARVKKRTTSLAYPKGGYLTFAYALAKKIVGLKGNILYGTEITELVQNDIVRITYKNTGTGKLENENYDAVIVTLPSFLFLKIAPQLPDTYKHSLVKLNGLSATNLVLRLKKQFFPDNTYWMSICEPNAPIMAIIEHTNFMDKKYYDNKHIVYIGNYATTADKLDWSKEKILKFYDPFLHTIHPNYKKQLIGYEFFKAPFAQPIVPTNYSKIMPKMKTPLSKVFLANIEQVYPWDRGTNYAVELGQKAAKLVSGIQ